MEDQLFFIGQKAFIENDEGAILILKNTKGQIDFPGGKIQIGETDFPESLRREVREETNLEIEIGKMFYAWHFTLPSEHKDAGRLVYLVGFRCRLAGGVLTLSDEHSSSDWIKPEQLLSLNDGSEHFLALKKYFEVE
jgi:8-oxo-dGTP pyrophosphatase MutT (NUDIX family)